MGGVIVLWFFLLSLTISFVCFNCEKIVCGRPPLCFYYTTIRLIECKDIVKLPDFDRVISMQVTTMILIGHNMENWPDKLSHKVYFPELNFVSLKNTKIDCDQVPTNLWYQTDCVVRDYVSRRKNISASVRPAPKLKTVRPEIRPTSNGSNGSSPSFKLFVDVGRSSTRYFTTLTLNADIATENNVTVTTVGTFEGPLSDRSSTELIQSWLIGSVVSSGIIIILLILFVVMKYRRQHGRYCNGSKCCSDVKTQSHSVETLGAMSLSSSSSIELFEAPGSSTPRVTSLRRRSVEKEL